jgi:hypothetical protein
MLRNGREIFSGTSQELIDSDNSYIQDFILGTELLPERTESAEVMGQQSQKSEPFSRSE